MICEPKLLFVAAVLYISCDLLQNDCCCVVVFLFCLVVGLDKSQLRFNNGKEIICTSILCVTLLAQWKRKTMMILLLYVSYFLIMYVTLLFIQGYFNAILALGCFAFLDNF